jgi:SAM-dependent methyltransferase
VYKYPGEELEIFSQAICWKSYCSSQIHGYLGQRVLEVGAGIGATTRTLCNRPYEIWLALEPDSKMAAELTRQVELETLPSYCKIQCGTLEDVIPGQLFNTILYVDVLEHIKDDFSELQRAANLLSPGGFLIVLAPAYQCLYTSFDRAIGHYRRYSLQRLLDLTPVGVKCVRTRYLDSVGLLALLGNRGLLKAKHPTRKKIIFWDRYMVALSQILDLILFYSIGKSILVVWQREYL